MDIKNYIRIYDTLNNIGCNLIFNYIFCLTNSNIAQTIVDDFNLINQSCHIFFLDENEYFLCDPRNPNHFTIKLYWENIIPKILYSLNKNLLMFEYELIQLSDNIFKYDLSYHQKKNDNDIYNFISISNRLNFNGNHNFVFRHGDGMSMYHRLCRDTHYSYIVENQNKNSNDSIFILCDSMAAPIIPIIAYFYKRIIVVDISHKQKPVIQKN